ncbi:MAG: hypothetical protein D3916_12835 [Candidatus Electrothrix sp. MAN1_4]|nr:hypothetical protein [Candidatus Electrothrix sp. MAN1_4]
MKYNGEEKGILDALEDDRVELADPSDAEINAVKTAAKRTFKKNKRVTIRLYDHDFAGIQKKALEMGIPYQTLISGIIHRYVQGDIKIKPA